MGEKRKDSPKKSKTPGSYKKKQKKSGGFKTTYNSKSYKKSSEIRTRDLRFTANYAAGYTPDTEPAQQLNLNTNTASVQALNLVQQGVGIAQRNGNKISMKSLRLRLSLRTTANVSTLMQNARVLVIYDRQPNGAYPAINTILVQAAQNNTTVAGIMHDNIDPNLMDRYLVLMDEWITTPPYNLAGPSGPPNNTTSPSVIDKSVRIDRYIKLNDLEARFSATANPCTIATLATGALYIATFGEAAPGTDPFCLYGSARLRFHEN